MGGDEEVGRWRVGHRRWRDLDREKGGFVKEQIWKDTLGSIVVTLKGHALKSDFFSRQ